MIVNSFDLLCVVCGCMDLGTLSLYVPQDCDAADRGPLRRSPTTAVQMYNDVLQDGPAEWSAYMHMYMSHRTARW